MNDFTRIIESNAPMSYESILALIISDFEGSEEYSMMLKAREYYKNKNDITQKKRYNIVDGRKVENTTVANAKISHPFLRDLADQKVQYLLSNDWSVDDKSFTEFLDDKKRKIIDNIAKDSITYGIGWLFVYPDGDKLKIKRMNPLNIIPIWADEAHTELESFVNRYTQIEYIASQKKTITYAEWWDKDGVKIYKQNDRKFIKIEEKTHVTDDEGNNYNWTDKLPLIPLKYNDDELSLLQFIKPSIDEYDNTISGVSDLLQDAIDKIKAVSGAEGTNVKELATNLKNYRLMLLPDGGDIKEVGSDAEITQKLDYLTQLRKDIYDFGRGVDNNANIGANASGAARQYLYAGLDLDCNGLESGVLECLMSLVWFLNNSPIGDYDIPDNVKIEFTRNMMVNTAEQVDTAIKLQGITGVTQETILSVLPMIDDPQEELEKYKKQTTAEIIEQQKIIDKTEE